MQERILSTLEDAVASSGHLSDCALSGEPLHVEQIEALALALTEIRDALKNTVDELHSGDPP